MRMRMVLMGCLERWCQGVRYQGQFVRLKHSWCNSDHFFTMIPCTPEMNMEPENTCLEKENHLPNHHFQVLSSTLIFGGVPNWLEHCTIHTDLGIENMTLIMSLQLRLAWARMARRAKAIQWETPLQQTLWQRVTLMSKGRTSWVPVPTRGGIYWWHRRDFPWHPMHKDWHTGVTLDFRWCCKGALLLLPGEVSFQDSPTSTGSIAFDLGRLKVTVDGRNPAPVDMENLPLFTRLYTSQVVVWDFFHQRYWSILWFQSGVSSPRLDPPWFDLPKR